VAGPQKLDLNRLTEKPIYAKRPDLRLPAAPGGQAKAAADCNQSYTFPLTAAVLICIKGYIF
jgi:hypothetical protein